MKDAVKTQAKQIRNEIDRMEQFLWERRWNNNKDSMHIYGKLESLIDVAYDVCYKMESVFDGHGDLEED